jgi:hypothetical protein
MPVAGIAMPATVWGSCAAALAARASAAPRTIQTAPPAHVTRKARRL